MSLKLEVSNTRHGNPGVSGWYAILPEPEPPRILEQALTADWLVIGGGFAGLSAARRLQQLREQERIVLLDSIRIGEGSSGRNSGFMIDLPHDISTDSYAGAVQQDIRQTQKIATPLPLPLKLPRTTAFHRRSSILAEKSMRRPAHPEISITGSTSSISKQWGKSPLGWMRWTCNVSPEASIT